MWQKKTSEMKITNIVKERRKAWVFPQNSEYGALTSYSFSKARIPRNNEKNIIQVKDGKPKGINEMSKNRML
jgi:hypothetical protein